MLNTLKDKSIRYILQKYEIEPAHSKQVKKLALLLFDKTYGILHNFSEKERDLLEAGALLHDIGYYISANAHNKHSAKLIRKERPSGFTDEETAVIALIARYHRGKKPKEKHEYYSSLSEQNKQLTRKLSAFCKLADALDCSHLSIVENFNCIYNANLREFFIILNLNMPDCSVELAKSRNKKDLLENEFNIKLIIKID